MSTHTAISNKIHRQYSQHTNNTKTASANTTNKASKNGLPYVRGSGSNLNTSLTAGTYSIPAAAKYLRDNDKNKDGQLSRDEVTLSDAAYAKLDANSDGKVTKAELQNALRGKDAAIYQYYKSGGSKTHSKDVVTTLLSNAGGTGGSDSTGSVTQAASRYIRDHDKNKDGRLSRAETTLSAEEYAKLDVDADGKLTRSELEKALNGKKGAIDKYYSSGGEKTHDADMAEAVLFTSNAGSITNFSGLAASRLFKDRDRNGDGVLSASEASLSPKTFSKIDKDKDKKITLSELNTALAGKNAAIQTYYKNGGTDPLAKLAANLLKVV